jgi:endoribonuclease Dicer
MSNLLAKQDFASVIHDPREYQLELFERAKERNIIAVLDTGTSLILYANPLFRVLGMAVSRYADRRLI